MAAESQPCLKLWLFFTASILRAERGITISQPKLLEHNDMKWIKADELAEYEFCPADEEIIRRLRQHRTKTALRLSTTSAAPEGSALGVLFFRHSAQNSLDNRQVNCARFAHSDEKIDGASAALSLCGIALKNRYELQKA